MPGTLQPTGTAPARARAVSAMSALVYRSRATEVLSPPDLLKLTLAAQARNRHERVSGVMLYDDRNFFQWLEGPDASVDRIMASIQHDDRHTDIEILDRKPVTDRVFGNWSMKLATAGANAESLRREIVEPPRHVVETLRRRPDAAPSLLIKLVPVNAHVNDALAEVPLGRKTADILRGVMLSAVIPQLLGKRVAAAARAGRTGAGMAHPRARDLAELLIATDQSAAMSLIEELRAAQALPLLYAKLFEPAARVLGDLWRDDDCSEFEVTLGLGRLQSAVRLLGRLQAPALVQAHTPLVLVAPEPGELHALGAVLDSDALEQAGWAPRCEYPATDEALQHLVEATWFDALDLSLSASFTREHRLPDLTATIGKARRASRNPALIVLVGGRAFVEDMSNAGSVGADLATKTSLNLNRSILGALHPPGSIRH